MLFNRILVNLSLLSQGKITLRQIPPKIINRIFNYSRLARHAKRSKFAINDVTFRTIKEDDHTRYHEFINDYFKRNVVEAENKISLPKCGSESFCYVALCRNRIVGKVEFRRVVSETGSMWQIAGLSILHDFRGYGIGEELLNRGISTVNENNPVLLLDVNKDNLKAIKLYRKLGFRVIDAQEKFKLKTIYPKYSSERIIMLKGA